MTGRFDIHRGAFFGKIAKKLKMESHDGKTSFLLNYFKTFKNCAFLGPFGGNHALFSNVNF